VGVCVCASVREEVVMVGIDSWRVVVTRSLSFCVVCVCVCVCVCERGGCYGGC